MPPSASKDAAPAVRPMLGHFKSHLKIGIVGLPNVGKSTFFNILTKSAVPVENFPFCTLESNQAHVNVMDERFDWLCQLYKPKSEVAVFLEIIDIPGLVRGANAGEGRGNAFLSDIRVVDEIFHVLRVFEDVDIIHVNDTVDPVRDLEIIGEELRLKDVQFVDKRIEDLQVMKSMKRSNYKKLNAEIEFCERVRTHFKEGKDIRFGDWAAGDVEILNTLQLLTAKPVVYLVNMSEKDFLRKKNKFLKMIDDWVKGHGRETIIPFSCAIKHKLVGMSEDEASNHCAENQLKSVIPKIIKTAFAEIHLIYFFTAGPDEVKCWQIRRETKAPRAAGAIHTDFERGFICAESNQSSTSAAQEASGARRIRITTMTLKRTSKEVMKFEDLKELGSESAVKAAGKYKYEGNTYEVQDGDIILFKSYLRGGRKK